MFNQNSNSFEPLNPGSTFNIGSPNHLTQVQHKFNQVEIVDHFDKGPDPIDLHIVTTINKRGEIDTDIFGGNENKFR